LDSYLSIAEKVLRDARRPLTAREILNRAYLENLVPPQLHGHTQHKTLGARLSEDILAMRERSIFFRTAPGSFFLRTFLNDLSIPEKYRSPLVAKRRQRELIRGRVLSVSGKDFTGLTTPFFEIGRMTRAFEKNDYHYQSKMPGAAAGELAVWSFVIVTRGEMLLTYRHGKYREGRDEFLRQKSLGFFSPVVEDDADIFDGGDRGIVSSGLKAIQLDLDLPLADGRADDYRTRTRLECFVSPDAEVTGPNLLAVIRFECPEWFEPVGRRLAINDLRWMNFLTPINSIDDFDPWSRRIFDWVKGTCSM
jgi:hypothetical protein